MAKKIQVGAGGNKLRQNQEQAGIPESKPFVAPDSERLESGVDRILTCHINGVAVSELGLDGSVLSALDYWGTDEGMAERNQRPMVREKSGVTLGKDPFAKSLDQKRDDVKNRGMNVTIARDPLREVADKYVPPGSGMHPKFLSQKRVQENGGTGDYEIVKDSNGDPVKVKGMILGQAPEEVVEARRRQQLAVGNERLKQIGEQYKREGGETAVADQ